MKKIVSSLVIVSFLLTSFISSQSVFAQTAEPEICSFTAPTNAKLTYDYEFVGSKKKLAFLPGELNQVTIYIKNTGTMPMFSDEAGCTLRPVARLGTAKPTDHQNPLYTTLQGTDSRWINGSRIKMDQNRVNPGEKGSFTFWTKAPQATGIYREYFDVVLEGKQWINRPFVVNFDVGEFMSENRENLQYITESKLLNAEDLIAKKSIEVDVSSQKMYLKIGDTVIKTFPVSTGKWSTPTPYGRTQIYYKQEVRVSGGWPHYIMPKWMNFRHGGYGIHALPSIRYDNGYYWREALNHIGTPRSHGCIRLLPADAEFAYEWTEVGTPVWVYP